MLNSSVRSCSLSDFTTHNRTSTIADLAISPRDVKVEDKVVAGVFDLANNSASGGILRRLPKRIDEKFLTLSKACLPSQ